MPTLEHVRAERARRSLAEFVRQAWAVAFPGRDLEWAWYLDAKCDHLQAVTAGHIRRLAITTPPNTLKSFVAGVCWPAWEWATDPGVRWLYAANDGPLATRDALAMRALVTSPWYTRNYRRDWGLAADQDVKTWFNTTAGGHRVSYAVGGKVTGKKGDRLVVDDPNDAKRVRSAAERQSVVAWHDEAFSGRMTDERVTPEVVIGQRLHPDDLVGHLLRKGGWVELRLPEEFDPARRTVTVPLVPGGRPWQDPRAAAGEFLRPARFGAAERDDRLGVLGSAGFQAQHNQHPQAAGGTFFDRAKATLVPAPPVGTVCVRYWDTAATKGEAAANTAGVLLGRTPAGRYLVADCVAGNWTPGERNEVIRQTCAADRQRGGGLRVVKTFVERPSGFGTESVELLIRFLAGFSVEADPVNSSDGSKEDRAGPLRAQWEVGNVDVLDGTWAEAYLAELAEFPGGRRKDRADASAGAFNKVCRYSAEPDGGRTARPDQVLAPLPAGTFD